MTNNTQRVLTGIVGAPLVVLIMYAGGIPFAVLVLAIALIAQYELYRLMEQGGLQPQRVAGLVLGVLVVLHPLVPWFLALTLAGFLVLIAASPFHTGDKQPLHNLSATVFGVIYPSGFLAFLLSLRTARGVFVDDIEAFYLTLTTILLVWAADTFAYFVGRSFGKHKLAPSVSPKKTWEGSVGGALGALLVAVVLKLTLLGFVDWIHILVIALICGIVSQLGDLAESKMKRSVGAKDSGAILPGHGGLLDRFDAMILASPLVYLYLDLVARLFEQP